MNQKQDVDIRKSQDNNGGSNLLMKLRTIVIWSVKCEETNNLLIWPFLAQISANCTPYGNFDDGIYQMEA